MSTSPRLCLHAGPLRSVIQVERCSWWEFLSISSASGKDRCRGVVGEVGEGLTSEMSGGGAQIPEGPPGTHWEARLHQLGVSGPPAAQECLLTSGRMKPCFSFSSRLRFPPSPFPLQLGMPEPFLEHPRRKTVIWPSCPRGGSFGTLMSFRLPLGDQTSWGRCRGRELASATLSPGSPHWTQGYVFKCPSQFAKLKAG